jgi:hypothetical protein
MSSDELYDAWRRRRAEPEVSADFADRVLAAVRDRQERGAQRSTLRGLVVAVLLSRAGKVGICSLALAAWVFRVLLLFDVFLSR